MKKTEKATTCWLHYIQSVTTRPTVLSQSVAGGDSICVGDHHRVSAQIVFIGVIESQSGAEKQTQKP